MIIRTQSRESIVEVVHVFLSDMVGEKSYYISGTCAGHGVFSGSRITLGIYPSKSVAMEELDRITDFFSDNPNGLYKMG